MPELAPPSPQSWNVSRLLEWATGFFRDHGIDTPRLDAEVLLAHTLALGRLELYTHYDRPLIAAELAAFKDLILHRARKRLPVAYILGQKEFWSLPLKVSQQVLIPRPDTECLVEAALARLPKGELPTPMRLVDVCTGSGAVALALQKERPHLEIWATDISEQALAIAAENSRMLGLEGIRFVHGDLLLDLPPDALPLHMIVANPPYLRSDEMAALAPELLHEPAIALDGGEDGLVTLRRLLEQSWLRLAPEGFFLCEIGHEQGESTRLLAAHLGYEDTTVLKDYGNCDRVLVARRP